MGKYVFGVDIGGTTAKIGLLTEEGEKVELWEIPTRKENNGSSILSDVAESVKAKIAEKKLASEDIIGIGLGVPGAVDADGMCLQAVNLGWSKLNVVKELESLTGFKVKAGNDANVAALGEQWRGGGQGHQNMLLVTLGTGVGGGIGSHRLGRRDRTYPSC